MPHTKTRMKEKNSKSRLPKSWTPRFWELIDGRLVGVKFIKRLVNELQEDGGCDSIQKKLLAERAAFLALQLQTQEIEALEGGAIDLGVYTQMCNALSGLLMKIGLDKKLKQAGDLQEYVNGKWQ